MTTTASLEETLKAELEQLTVALTTVGGEPQLRAVHAQFCGASGSLRAAQKEALKAAAATDKREIGQLTNQYVQAAEGLLEARKTGLAEEERQRELGRAVDVTLPGRTRRLGHLHPLTRVRREIEEIFARLGFAVKRGPQVDTDFHNFEALAMPKDHPARDMQDTFYIAGAPELVLRTHTSPVQIRTMLAEQPPIRMIAPGVVYRKDDDSTHSPMFNQVEGLVVDRNVRFSDLKGILLYFAKEFFGGKIGVRLRPSFFPFTEPSAEIDFACVFCGGSGCRTCKGTGWIEIGGAGMVDPEVFAHVGYDAEEWSGFAFGWGIDRMAMLRYDIRDIKQLFDGDVRFVSQFRPGGGR